MGIFILYNIYIKNNMRKIIITESQANMLKTHLFESVFKKFAATAKKGDTIKVKISGQDKEFRVVSFKDGKPIMELIKNGTTDNKLYYLRSFSTTLKGTEDVYMGIADKQKDKNKLNNPKIWTATKFSNVESVDLFRNNQKIDSIDKVNQSKEQPYGDEDLNEKELDEKAAEISSYLDIVGDEVLRKAFYKAPSLLKLFIAELKGERAKGTGIMRAYEALSNFGMYDTLIDAEFKENGVVIFKPLSNQKIGDFDFNMDNMYNTKVMDKKLGEKYKLISGNYKTGNKYFVLELLNKVKEGDGKATPDTFRCKIKSVTKSGAKIEEKELTDNFIIEIVTEKSPGYSSKDNTKEEN